ncbi:MAG: serine hydroxymethyltransferase [Candidatus Raymondbacteria bacterium RifOxyA12_full_50_37]|uniref:Serine hydroxymethyltransferase n=1 Tax=Candidatus Raymondbacteria bacterium RIFOXYD12_FULL_49_13 TaxID=1817890 RepID=A0A1F7FLH5_UNCRA|nr:MAG: serine hydroxymethyltransferase [Candidatus Raymondbacteria bacterium RifOxyA12_full_50_37]OGJ85453.1 MAG: serine hydroxymethyltransferase [Candidatus Raymondbacteria bacterium RIFOXYA2_FULL_49_16]OGJ94961.1 MAG: serine hydroxymethyltransferase [Candidatus Raymondbacteria bacterium RIFOXYC2_FULL_50_21]OGJ99401.1 MAG: serine hydroxymethyltransferase [Candidatus Raymondbacteria bacterium RifOxyB12_full_50_8]OGK01893.1 MAG: serine hydroxymethyltransferase [Candidatus Raymondbacteria bacter
MMDNLKKNDPAIFDMVVREQQRQEEGMELIASENYVSRAVLEAMGTVLNNKYSEGYVGKRYYAGNEIVDEVEQLCMDRARALFGCEHVNVQPLSGSPANAAVYFALLKPGDKVLGLALDHGGHLSHGHPVNFSGMLYNFTQYMVEKETGRINMDRVREIALRERPKMILAGFSAYSRNLDWKIFKAIADEIGAITFADIAHIAGLIAGKQLDSPIPHFDVVSTTTHKTLRGPRGAIIMCKEKFAKQIDTALFPGLQGGPHDHINAAKAVAFKEALEPSFQTYSKKVMENAKMLAAELMRLGFKVISDGTDNHLMVVDMTSRGVPGLNAERALDAAGISCSRSTIPFDPRKPFNPSGVRLGTPAITTRGMGNDHMKIIAGWIDRVVTAAAADKASESLKGPEMTAAYKSNSAIKKVKEEVKEFCLKFPLFHS